MSVMLQCKVFDAPRNNYIAELFLAGVSGTGVWVFGEHLVSHGHITLGAFVNFLAFVIYFAAAPITAVRIWPRQGMVWGLFGVFVFVMGCAFILFSRPPAELKAKPHLTFSLFSSNTPEDFVELTNDFVIDTNIGNPRSVLGCLVVPIQPGQSNVLLRFAIQSPATAENAEIFCFFPREWDCLPDFGWVPSGFVASPVFSDSSGYETNEMQSWLIRIPFALLPGDNLTLPGVLIRKIPMPGHIGHKITAGDVAIMAKVKDWPPSGVSFQTSFVPIENKFEHKPIMTLLITSNGTSKWSVCFPFVPTNGIKK